MSFPAFSYTGAQFKRDIGSTIGSIQKQDFGQALGTLGEVGGKLCNQVGKRAMEYVVNGLNTGEIGVAQGDELKAKHLRMLAPAAAISGTIHEPTGGWPALYLKLECNVDIAWTIGKGVELAKKRTMNTLNKAANKAVEIVKANPVGTVIGAGAFYLMPFKKAAALLAGITYTASQIKNIVD